MSGSSTYLQLPEDVRVLVIDDEETMRQACTEVLRREGFQVSTAASGDEALRMVQSDKPDVAFIDFKMPGLPGMAILDEFNVESPGTVKVVMTAYATISAALTALRHGAFDFLPKPFTPDELRSIAMRAVEHRKLLVRNSRLAEERDKAKRRFVDLVTKEVQRPVEGALSEINTLSEKLADAPELQVLAQCAGDRLKRLLDMVDRWHD